MKHFPMILAAALAPAAPAQASSPAARTPDGEIAGLAREGTRRFLGIRYARPPVGALRWRPPEPAPRWTGAYRAVRFGSPCPQDGPSVFATPGAEEDCLFLNVFAPARAARRGKAYPVMVWLHGGGLTSGSGADYDGSGIARAGVIVVTVNYRLGALGFLSHPALDGEGHAAINYGIMDQQLALRWVRRNIAAFGGDPGRVTLAGQSAGATSVLAGLISPGAQGLFHRAIVQSATRFAPLPRPLASERGRAFASAAGCEDQSAECLRNLPVARILASQRQLVATQAAHFPAADGAVVPEPPLDAFAAGRFARMPILSGLVSDEQAYFLAEVNGGAPLDAAGYAQWAATIDGGSGALLARYPLAAHASPSEAEIAAAQDMKACEAQRLFGLWARHVPVYAYEFADRAAPSYMPPVSYPLGAYHTAELQYLFPGFRGGRGSRQTLSGAQQRLSRQMVALWTRFAHAGRPAARGVGSWPAFGSRPAPVARLATGGIGFRPSIDLRLGPAACAFWDR